MSLGISTNLEAVTTRYVDMRIERKKEVLDTYHKAVHATDKDTTGGKQTKKPQKKVTIWSYKVHDFY